MVLTSTQTQLQALYSDIRNVCTKILVYRNDYPDVPVDISDYVEEVSINVDLANRNSVCKITLNNEGYLFSPKNKTSPFNLVDGEYNPLIYPNHVVKVYIGLVTTEPEYWLLFTGITGDEISVSENATKLYLSVRDFSKRLQDTYIYLSKSYDYQLAEDVIQGLINENGLDVSLKVIGQTNFLIQHYQVRDNNLWDAIQKVADLMGWILMFNEEGILILKEEKGGDSPDLVIDESIFEVEELTMSDADIRNDILVRAETPDGVITVNVKDDASIAEFGRRFMQVDRSLSSMIYTYDQAYNLAQRILDDLSWLHSVYRVNGMPIFPPIQVDDLVAVVSERTGARQEELFKVVSIEHIVSATQKRTNLYLKSYKKRSPISYKTPLPPSNLSSSILSWKISNYPNSGWTGKTKTIYYPKVTFSKPTKNTDGSDLLDLVGYVVSRSEKSSNEGFIDLRSFPSKDANGNDITYFIDYSAGHGKKWYRVASVNSKGVKSSYSDVLEVEIPPPFIEN